ncbi:MAG: TonB-dependent receptor [Bacteroidales bacterium]|nr:TonB-dependent receptor [Candidatus Physcousia equi]
MKNTWLSFCLCLPCAAALGSTEVGDSAGVWLDDVVVAASRWSEPSIHQSKHIKSVTPEQVAEANPMNTADLLELVGGVGVQKSQLGGGSPMIRGMATNRLLYSVDGVRMNTAIFRSGNLQNVISLDPLALERTELLFGPGSVIYGSDAMGGVMSFTTKNPQFAGEGQKVKLGGTAMMRCASASGEVSGHFDVNAGSRRWASLTSISSYNYGDLRQGRFGPDEYLKPWLVQREGDGDHAVANPDPLVQSPSAYKQINLMQKVGFRPCEVWDLQAAFHYSTTTDYARYDRHTRLKKGLPQYGEWNYGPQVWMLGQLTAKHTGRTPIYNEMSIRLAYQRFEESRTDRKFGKPERTTTEEGVDAWSVGADFAKRVGHHALCYGLEYVRNDVQSKGRETNVETQEEKPALARYPQSAWESYAAYAQMNFALLPVLNLEAGLRYNHYRLVADFTNHDLDLGFAPHQTLQKGSVSASLGVSYRPGRQWLLRLGAMRGFRTPNVDDLGKLYESVVGAVVVPNPALKPEYANSIEVGVAKKVASWLRFDVAAYYTYLQNAFVRRPYLLGGQSTMIYKGEEAQVLAIQNAASAYVTGFELSADGDLPAGFGYNLNLVYQHGDEELDDGSRSTLRHTVPFYGRVGVTYRHDKLKMELFTRFQAQRNFSNMPESELSKTEIYALDADGHPYSPAWCTLNLRASYEAFSGFTIHAGIENLTDRRYRTYSSGISAPGRNFVASLMIRF